MSNLKRTLGLDLGTNSLGWAIVEESGAIVDAGVVIFDEGIDRSQRDTQETPAAIRRAKRMARRIKFRRRLRKLATLDILVANGMCPLSKEALTAWKQHNIYPLNDKPFREWLKSTPETNPYADRDAASRGKVSPETLGRALYHIAQRRGFLSSRKDAMAEEEGDKATGAVKGGISDLSHEISEAECETLGQYFYKCFKDNVPVRRRYTGRKEHYEVEFRKICETQGLSAELTEMLHKAIFHQRPLRSQKHLVGKCPLEKDRPRCMIMRPEFEEFRMLAFVNNLRIVTDPSKKGHDGCRELTEAERVAAIAKFYVVAKYIKVDDVAKTLGSLSGGKKAKPAALNMMTGRTVSSCSVTQQLNLLFGTKGDGFRTWKHSFTNTDGKTHIYDYNTVIDAITFFQDNDKLREFGRDKLGFSDEQAERLTKIRFAEGYANYSLKAINKILPFLRKGIELTKAVKLAKFPDIFGKNQFEANRDDIIAEINDLYDQNHRQRELAFRDSSVKVIPLATRISDHLRINYGIPDEKISALYSVTESGEYEDCRESGILPPVRLGMIRNPLVQRSMTILRRLVNHLRQRGLIDAETKINVELARDVNDYNTRCAYADWQKRKEKERAEIADKIRELKKSDPTEDDITRWQLAEEQGWKCLYTGLKIKATEIFSATSSFDIEHTVPRSRSGDNSLANKTLCDAHYNRMVKQGRLPTECPNYDQGIDGNGCVISTAIIPWTEKLETLEKTYSAQMSKARAIPSTSTEAKAKARQKALLTKIERDYWRKKVSYFTATADDLGDGFMNRQLVDTGIMTRHAISFLGSVYHGEANQCRVWAVNGAATAFARKEWDLQDTNSPKLRIDHVHHAIDAIVIAELSRARFTDICRVLKDDGKYSPVYPDGRVVAPPFEGFAARVHEITDGIVIKHFHLHRELKPTAYKCRDLARPHKTKTGMIRSAAAGGDTVRGPLHKETFYGKIRLPGETRETFVVRKALASLGEKDIEDIIDPVVREQVSKQLGAYLGQGMVFAKAIQQKFYMKQPDADGKGGVEIKKVRIKAGKSSAKELRRQIFESKNDYKIPYYVDTADGSNFRLSVYEKDLCIDNLLDWVQWHKRNPEKLEHRELGTLQGCVSAGSAVLFFENTPTALFQLPPAELKKRMAVIQKYNYTNSVLYVMFIRPNEARPVGQLAREKTKKVNFDTLESDHFCVNGSTLQKHALFEGIDFDISFSGEVIFKNRS